MPAVRLTTLSLLLALLAAPSPAWAEDTNRPVDPEAKLEAVLLGLKAKDAETRVKAATEAKTLQAAALTSPLTRLLSDKESGVREAVIDALGARVDRAARKKAASALAGRLPRLSKHVADQPELLQIIGALGALQQSSTVKALLDDIDVEVDAEIVRARLFAVAAIPHKQAIEGLITFLAKGRRGGRGKHRDMADKALRYATGAQPHKENRSAGRDADRWRAWWRENEKTFSFDAVQDARAEAEQAAEEKAERQKEKRAKREARKNKPKTGRKKKPGKRKKPTDGGDA
jgi:hypothetical protein